MSVTWTQTIGGALQRAYLMIGCLAPPTYTMSDFQLTQGLTVANGVLQALQTEGANVFRQTPTSLTVTAGTPTVPIPNDVVGIEEARWVQSTNPLYERPLGRFQWAQYMQLPNKNAQGAPSIFMFDYQRDTTQLYAWPVNQTSGTINCTTIRRANNVLAVGDAIDLPPEWMLGFDYMLADALMDDQGIAQADPATAQRITGHAQFWKQKLLDFDRPTSVTIKPWGKQGNSAFWR